MHVCFLKLAKLSEETSDQIFNSKDSEYEKAQSDTTYEGAGSD